MGMLLGILMAGVLLGLLSSLHCVGMCGPLAFAVPFGGHSRLQKAIGALVYHGARILMYVLLGLVMGLLGRGFIQWIPVQLISIVAGIILLLLGIFQLYQRKQKRSGTPSARSLFGAKWQRWMGKWLHKPGKLSLLMLGMGNGLLPCGMVYMALISSVAWVDQWWNAPLWMLGFGLGTLPAMFLLTWAGACWKWAMRSSFQAYFPHLTIAAGVLLMIRGLNLGLPFLSPLLPHANGTAIPCG